MDGVNAQVSGIDSRVGTASNAKVAAVFSSRNRSNPYKDKGIRHTVNASRIWDEPSNTASGYKANPQAAK